MSKKRLYEIAKELGKSSKEIVDYAQELGLDVKSHSSSVDELQNLRVVISRQNVKRVLKPKQKNELKAAIKSAITIKDATIVLIVTDKRMPKTIANIAIAILKIIIEEINSVIITKEISEMIAINQLSHVSISRHVQLH